MLTVTGPNGIAHTNMMNGLGDLQDEEKEEVLDVNQVQAELMLDVTAQEMMLTEYPADCCPVKCYIHFPCIAGEDDSPFWQGWANLRIKTFRLIENKYFETAVIAMILISSLALVRNIQISRNQKGKGKGGGYDECPEEIYLYRVIFNDGLKVSIYYHG